MYGMYLSVLFSICVLSQLSDYCLYSYCC